ncbi:M20/M25/M40 family metallo-hydrolase [Woodsholea maritima]|uniref:M20/M25/M40 family metallo-hydrolase n=1 Tax=Woodsholea maritima TaxID=240237 RepID=UPI0012EAE448|nr:M20/M25/M40 family metallo-hydrolase [Woodsholea maritima]
MKSILMAGMVASFAVITLGACSGEGPRLQAREQQALEDVRILSADEMAGRAIGTQGGALARDYILARYTEMGLQPLGDSFEHPFSFEQAIDFRDPESARETFQGINLIARIPGESAGPVMVVGAHYDHVGVIEDEIYNGADDNASGVAGLLAIAQSFMDHPPAHDVILIAFDGEEMGLRGARAFVDEPPLDLTTVAFMLNMDMIGYNTKNELYAVGTYHFPFLKQMIEAAAIPAPVTLLMGYDEPSDNPRNDWTLLSDQGAFIRAGIPAIYLGVEDHEHYHEPSDDYEVLTTEFFLGAIAVSVDVAHRADAQLDEIAEAHAAQKAAAQQAGE